MHLSNHRLLLLTALTRLHRMPLPYHTVYIIMPHNDDRILPDNYSAHHWYQVIIRPNDSSPPVHQASGSTVGLGVNEASRSEV